MGLLMTCFHLISRVNYDALNFHPPLIRVDIAGDKAGVLLKVNRSFKSSFFSGKWNVSLWNESFLDLKASPEQ